MENKFTVLRLDQIVGKGMLDVFKRYGAEAEVTGYAIRRGTRGFKLKGKYFAAHGLEVAGNLLDKLCCEYWTSTKADGSISKAYSYGRFDAYAEAAWDDNNGIRVVVPLEMIKDQITDRYTVHGDHGDVTVVTYGEYPQKALSYDERKQIDELYENGSLKPTGKKYGAMGYRIERYYDGDTRKFEEDDYLEYEINGEKYVLGKEACFDNGNDRHFWAKVEPIEWLVDEETGLAITKKCLVGGIPLSRKGVYLGNFDRTLVQDFIDNDFSYDIKPKNKEIVSMLEEVDTDKFDVVDENKKSL